jgi:nucleoside-diphosphate-sugar epimerase
LLLLEENYNSNNMVWCVTKIAVTGCAGVIGSWLCDKALAAGYDVIGIDNLSSGINF